MTGPDAKHVDRWVLIDPKRGEFVTRREMWIREALGFTYRFLLSVFLSAQLFDLFFSSIWLHGYICYQICWAMSVFRSLNNQIDVDLSDKSAGYILDHQLGMVGYMERLVHAVLSTVAVVAVLRVCEYHRRPRSIWHLLALSLTCGMASALVRCVQMKYRLYSAIHEAFYIYSHFFVIGLCMTWRRRTICCRDVQQQLDCNNNKNCRNGSTDSEIAHAKEE